MNDSGADELMQPWIRMGERKGAAFVHRQAYLLSIMDRLVLEFETELTAAPPGTDWIPIEVDTELYELGSLAYDWQQGGRPLKPILATLASSYFHSRSGADVELEEARRTAVANLTMPEIRASRFGPVVGMVLRSIAWVFTPILYGFERVWLWVFDRPSMEKAARRVDAMNRAPVRVVVPMFGPVRLGSFLIVLVIVGLVLGIGEMLGFWRFFSLSPVDLYSSP